MNTTQALSSVVVLEALWETSKKDMIDLVSPMINYVIAKQYSMSDQIDVSLISKKFKDRFAYDYLPESIVKKSMARDKKHFKKENHNYYLIASLDNDVEIMEKRQKECVTTINELSVLLYQYLKEHCSKSKITSSEQTFTFLQRYLGKYGFNVGFEDVKYMDVHINDNEINYYISEFIYYSKENDTSTYLKILDIVKGFFLQNALYFQGDNTEIKTASFKNLTFFYDTPFLINILGYQSMNEHESAISLHNILKKEGASFYYYPQTEHEIINILTAYQYSLKGKKQTFRTLEGLDAKKYTYDGVERLKTSFSKKLEQSYGVKLHNLPSYAQKEDGSVDEGQVDISEREVFDYIKSSIPKYPDDSLTADVESALAVHRLRDGFRNRQFEKCKFIFVTTNKDFTRLFNKYYKDLFKYDEVFPVITDLDLSAFTWIKCVSTQSDIPEKQLLTNAYMSMQLPANIMEKCQTILQQLSSEGTVSEEEMVSIITDRLIQKELWKKTFPNPEDIDESYVETLRKNYKDNLLLDVKKEAEEKNNKIKDNQIKKAKEYALAKRNILQNILVIVLTIMLIVIAIICIIGLIQSLNDIKKTIALGAFIGISIISIIDTVGSKGKIFRKLINKICNRYETWEYEKKRKEYESLNE